MKILEKAVKLRQIQKEKGWIGVKQSGRRFYRKLAEKKNYQRWIKIHRITEPERQKMRREIELFRKKPKISVVMPVYNVGEKWLRLCVESVLKQLYENWELCIADDCSPSPHVRLILEEYAARDERIKVVFRPENGHISAASNSALELASGEITVLLDHDDELTEDALFYVAREINEFPETEMIYSDEDLIDENGRRYDPKFKPDWSRDLFYSLNLITHLSAYRTDVLRKIGGFRTGLEGSQDYDLALRVIEQIPENHIRHIPKILYHWRAIKGSVALDGDEKPYAHERAREALRSHFERTGKRALVSRSFYNLHRVRYELPAAPPKVCLIILTEDLARAPTALQNFIENTDYPNFEIVFVVSETNAESENLNGGNGRVVCCQSANEAARYNFAASKTDGEILCFADWNLKPESKEWLAEMASFAWQTEIGAAGAKLLYDDGTVLHGGLIVGAGEDLIGAAHRHSLKTDSGNTGRNFLTGNFSAVSVSCLATRRELFDEVGGFDAESFPNRFFDADFCLKLNEKNRRTVFTPYAELTKIDARRSLNLEKTPTAEEKAVFAKKWSKFVERDPFYNPNLSKKDASFSIAI